MPYFSDGLTEIFNHTNSLLSYFFIQRYIIKTKSNQVLLMQISDDLALVSTTKAGSRMGLVLVQLRRTVEEIRRHLGYMESAA